MDKFCIVTVTGRVISLPFLFLTYLHYWHTTKFCYLYRMCFMNYLVHLIICNCWIIWAIANNYRKKKPTVPFHVNNFIELSLLLWINVLCYDFWNNVRNVMPHKHSKTEKITFIKRLIYVWSCDIIYTTVGLINDYLLKDTYKYTYWAVTWLMLLFQVILLLINICVTKLIIKQIKINKYLRRSDVNKQNKQKYKKKLLLYSKLFVVTFSLSFSKWFWFKLDYLFKYPMINDLLNYLMAGNAFQGLFIFLLFGFNIKKIKSLTTTNIEIFSLDTKVEVN